MDWETVLIEWVNCLRLTERPIEKISELSDGVFFCEVLQIRFDKIVSVEDIPTVFNELKEALKGKYYREDWIDFTAASSGDGKELLNILYVLLATCSLQNHGKLFRENPASFLSSAVQIEIKKYLQLVLENGSVVSEELISKLPVAHDKENLRTPLKNFKNRNIPLRKVPESPHIYISSPQTPAVPNRREREISDTERRQTETIEKLNSELFSKSSTISELETKNSELSNKLETKNSEIKNLHEKNLNLKERLTDLEKSSETLTLEIQSKAAALLETKEQLTEYKSLYTRSETENDKLIRDNTGLKTEYDSLLEKLRSIDHELQESIYSSNVKIEDLSKQLEEKTKSLEDLNETNMALESKCSHLQQSLDSAKNSLEEAKLNVEKSEEEFSSALNSLSVDLEKERVRAVEAEEQLTEYKSLYSVSETEKNRLIQENASLVENLQRTEHELQDTISSNNVKLEDLFKQLEEKTKSLEDLNENNMALESKCSDLQQSLDSAKSSLEEAKLNVKKSEEEFSSTLNSMSVDLEKERVRAVEAEEQLTEYKSLYTRSETENEKLIRDNTGLKTEYDCLLEKLQRAEHELQETISSNHVKIEDLSKQLQEKTKSLEDLKETNMGLESKCSDLQQSLDSAKNSLEEAKLNIEKSEEEFSSALNSLSVDLEKERVRAVEAEEHLTEYKSLYSVSEAEKDRLIQENDSLVQKLQRTEHALQETISSNNVKIEDLSKQLAETTKSLDDLNENNMALESKCSDLQQSLNSANNSLEEAKLNVKKSEEEFSSTLNSMLVDLEKERVRAVEAEEQLTEYKSLYSLSETEKDRLIQENNSLVEKLQRTEHALQETISSNSAKIEDLSKQLEEKTKSLEDLNEANMSIESKCSDLQQSLDSAKNSLEEAKLSIEKSEEEFNSALSGLSVDLEKEQIRAVDAEEKVAEYKSLYSLSETENDRLIQENASLVEKHQRTELVLQETISSNSAKIEDLSKQLEEKTKSLEDLKETNMALESKCSHLQQSLDFAKNSLEEAKLNVKKSEEEFSSTLNSMSVDLEKERVRAVEAEEQLTEYKSLYTRSETENDKLIRDNTGLKTEYDFLLEKLQRTEHELQETISSNSAKIEDLSKQIQEKTKSLDDLKETNMGLESKCSDLQQSLDSAKNSIGEAKLNIKKSEEEFSSALSGLSVDLEKERVRAMEAEEKVAEYKSLYSLSETEKDRLIQENASLVEKQQRTEHELQETISSNNVKMEDLSKQLEEKTKSLEDLNETNMALESKCSDLQQSLDSAKNSLEEAKLNIEKSEEEFSSALNSMSVDLEKERVRAVEAEEQLTEYKSLYTRSETENDKLIRDNTGLKTEYDSLLEKLQRTEHELQDTISSNNVKIEDLSKQLEEKTKSLEDLNETNMALESKCSDLQQSLDSAKNSLEEAKLNIEKSEEEFSSALNSMSVDLEKERVRAVEAEEKVAEYKSLYSVLETEKARLIQENASLVEKLQRAEHELQDTISSNNVKMEDLSKQLEGKTKSLENLNETNKGLESKCSHLQQSLDSAKKSLEEAKLKIEKSEEEFSSALNSMSVDLEKERVRAVEAVEQLTEYKSLYSISETGKARLIQENALLVENLQRTKHELHETISSNSVRLEKLTKEHEMKFKNIDDLTNALKSKEDEIIRLKDELSLRVKELNFEKMEVERKIKSEMKEKFSKKLEEMKSKMARITGGEIEKMQKELSCKNEELTSMQEKLLQYSNYDDEIIDLKRERGQLKSANIDINNRLFSLNEALNKKTLEYDSLRRKYEELQLQLDLWKRKYDMLDIPDCSSVKGLSYAGSSVSSMHSNFGMDERRSSCVSLASIRSNGSTSSRKYVPQGAGSMFTCEDEDDGFQFSDKNLAELHRSSRNLECTQTTEEDPHERINEIQRRNTLLPVHMRSCYPSEEFGSNMTVDENHLRAMNQNTRKVSGNPGLQRQYGTLSLSKLKDDAWDEDNGPVAHQQRTPFSPTSSRLNKAGVPRPSTSLGFSPMKPKMKSDSALTPRKKNKPSMFRVPFARD